MQNSFISSHQAPFYLLYFINSLRQQMILHAEIPYLQASKPILSNMYFIYSKRQHLLYASGTFCLYILVIVFVSLRCKSFK